MGARLSYPDVDLSGKVAVVTGGNAGIGFETTKALARMGAHTILACRSEEKAKAAIELITVQVSSGMDGRPVHLEFMPLNLASIQSTMDFVAAFKEKSLPLHILVNNAGIAWVPQTITDDGFELQFQVNHLSHFLLTLELLPTLLTTARVTADCRIVFVSSSTHSWVGEWEPDNLNGEKWYGRTKFYPKSKLYNVMTAYALQRHLQNVGITVSSLHPGAVSTGIATSGFSDSKVISFLAGAASPFLRCPKDGAATTVNCAVNPELNSQQCFYYTDCRVVESSALSRNEQIQEELWGISINLLKDFLSPEILERYGSRQLTVGATEGGTDGRELGAKRYEPSQPPEVTVQGTEEGGEVEGENHGPAQPPEVTEVGTEEAGELGGREERETGESGQQQAEASTTGGVPTRGEEGDTTTREKEQAPSDSGTPGSGDSMVNASRDEPGEESSAAPM